MLPLGMSRSMSSTLASAPHADFHSSKTEGRQCSQANTRCRPQAATRASCRCQAQHSAPATACASPGPTRTATRPHRTHPRRTCEWR